MFCASGSEADNLAIKGAALARLGERDHLIISPIEHPAVHRACSRERRPSARRRVTFALHARAWYVVGTAPA